MLRLLPIVSCCALLAGCQDVPLVDGHSPVARDDSFLPKQRTIRVFDEVEAKSEAINQLVLSHLPPGTPIAQAQALLEEQDFSCQRETWWTDFLGRSILIPQGFYLPSNVERQVSAQRDRHPVYCHATLPELQEWHLASQRVLIVLVPDEAQRLKDVEVGVASGVMQRNSEFFHSRPDLHSPVGQPVDEARAQMAAAGFQCTDVRPQGADGDDRPHMLCQAFDEHWMGGHIVRVHLYPDASGIILQVKVLDETHWFDAERCMLPHGGEATSEAVLKGALFPLREAGRYAVVTLEASVVVLALGVWGYAYH